MLDESFTAFLFLFLKPTGYVVPYRRRVALPLQLINGLRTLGRVNPIAFSRDRTE